VCWCLLLVFSQAYWFRSMKFPLGRVRHLEDALHPEIRTFDRRSVNRGRKERAVEQNQSASRIQVCDLSTTHIDVEIRILTDDSTCLLVSDWREACINIPKYIISLFESSKFSSAISLWQELQVLPVKSEKLWTKEEESDNTKPYCKSLAAFLLYCRSKNILSARALSEFLCHFQYLLMSLVTLS